MSEPKHWKATIEFRGHEPEHLPPLDVRIRESIERCPIAGFRIDNVTVVEVTEVGKIVPRANRCAVCLAPEGAFHELWCDREYSEPAQPPKLAIPIIGGVLQSNEDP